MKRVEEFFKNNPQVGVILVTSDGFMFDKSQHAFNHSGTLEDKDVVEYTPEMVGLISATTVQDTINETPVSAPSTKKATAPAKAKVTKAEPVTKTVAPKKGAAAKGTKAKPATEVKTKTEAPAEEKQTDPAVDQEKQSNIEGTENPNTEQSN